MQNRKEHLTISSVSGAIGASLVNYTQEENGYAAFLNGVGGYYGGRLFACLPDIFDPPISSYHRALGHSVAFGAGGCCVVFSKVKGFVDSLNEEASRLEKEESVWSALWAIALRITAGFLISLPIGYVAHLIADLGTPRRLPLLY